MGLMMSTPDNKDSNRRVARRWNGNYKHASKKLSEVSKAKKMKIELSVVDGAGKVTTKVLEKKRQETLQHVLTKAVLWKLHCDRYPNIEIELDIGDKDYLPDVISLPSPDIKRSIDNCSVEVTASPSELKPLFWGESGRMKVHKAVDLMRRYPTTDIVHCRWSMELDDITAPLQDHLQSLYDQDALEDLPLRPGRFRFAALPLDVWRFIDEDTGMIHITDNDLEWRDLEFPTKKSNEG